MLGSQARVRHILLVTDSWSRTGDFEALIGQLNAAGITLSVIGAGGGGADFLRDLAERGGGRYYDAPSMDQVPQIFLQETKQALRSSVQQTRFTPHLAVPSPIIAGFDSLPPLDGYLPTTAKPAAMAVLLSDQREPVLAQWQYGLGRVVAWTSDAAGRWSGAWLAWDGFGRFWNQAAKWTLVGRSETLTIQTAVSGDRANLPVVTTEAGQSEAGLETTATVHGPDGSRREVRLRPTGPGHAAADLTGLATGAHLVTMTHRRSQRHHRRPTRSPAQGSPTSCAPTQLSRCIGHQLSAVSRPALVIGGSSSIGHALTNGCASTFCGPSPPRDQAGRLSL